MSFYNLREVFVVINIDDLKERRRIRITEFLLWNDRNGCYTDENCDLEGIPRMTCEDALKYFFVVMNDDFYYALSDNIFELECEEVIQHAKEQGFYDKTIKKLNRLVSNGKATTELYRSLI
jgi:hypothetical protein